MAVQDQEGGRSVVVGWRRICEVGGHCLQRRAAASPASRPWICLLSLPSLMVCKSDCK